MKKDQCKKRLKAGCKGLLDIPRRHGLAPVFLAAMCITLLISLVHLLIRGSYAVTKSLFLQGGDLYMDFFNSVRDAAQGAAVYTERHVIYPPMANLIMLIFSRCTPDAYNNTDFDLRYDWVLHPAAHLAFILYFAIPCILLLYLCYKQVKAGERTRAGIAFFALFNFPVIYMMERGNILIYTIVATFYFIFYHNDESKIKRELSLLALAFAFSLKLYPAILGWCLIADKRYREAGRCALYGFLMLLLPSFFFGGPQCFVWIAQNISSFSSSKHAFWTEEFFSYAPFPALIDYLPFLLAFALFLISPFILRERYKTFVLGCAALFAYPALNSQYAWAFLIAPLFLLFDKKKPSLTDLLYGVAIATPLLILPGLTKTQHDRMTSTLLFSLIALGIFDIALALYRRRHPAPDADKLPDPKTDR